MKLLITLFGALICLMALSLLVAPDKFRNLLNSWTGQPRFLFAVIVRVILGAIVLAVAADLKFPFVMKIIGGISIAAAIGILVMGQDRMDRFVGWWMRMSDTLLRTWSVFALAFGVFLIYVTL